MHRVRLTSLVIPSHRSILIDLLIYETQSEGENEIEQFGKTPSHGAYTSMKDNLQGTRNVQNFGRELRGDSLSIALTCMRAAISVRK